MRHPAVILFPDLLIACQGRGSKDADLSFSLAAHPDNALAADATVSLSEPGEVTIEVWSEAIGPLRTRTTQAGTDHEIPVVGLRADSTYQMQAFIALEDGTTLESDVQTFQTGAGPEGVPTFSVEGQADEGAITIVGTTRTGGGGDMPLFFGVDGEGEVVWHYTPEDAADEYDSLRSAEVLPNGDLLLMLDRVFRQITPTGETRREISASDVGYEEIHHDADPMPNGHLVVLAKDVATMQVPAFEDPVPVAWDVLVELDESGDVVWEWSALDHLDIDRWPSALAHELDPRTGYADWTHANSVYYDEVGDQFIVSLRHQNWIIAVDHATGEVNWTLGEEGDLRLETGEWFNAQHAATIAGDEVLLYDNGNEKVPPTSRAVAYRIDVEKSAARQTWEWRPGTYTSNLGDADRLPSDNVLVCVGGTQQNGGSTRISEVDRDGAVGWEMEMDGDLKAYRATRVSWLTPVQ